MENKETLKPLQMNPGRQQTTFDGCSVCVLVGYLKSVLSLGILCIDLFHS